MFRGRFAPVLHLFVTHLGSLIEVAKAGSFHGRDVHEHVFAAIIGLNKSKPLGCIEPLHSTCRHVTLSMRKTIVAVGWHSPRLNMLPQLKDRGGPSRQSPASSASPRLERSMPDPQFPGLEACLRRRRYGAPATMG